MVLKFLESLFDSSHGFIMFSGSHSFFDFVTIFGGFGGNVFIPSSNVERLSSQAFIVIGKGMVDIVQSIDDILEIFHFFFQGMFFVFEIVFDFVKSFTSSIKVSTGNSGFSVFKITDFLIKFITLFSFITIFGFSSSISINIISFFISFGSGISFLIDSFSGSFISRFIKDFFVMFVNRVQKKNIRDNLGLINGFLFNFLDIIFDGSKISLSNMSFGFFDDVTLFFHVFSGNFVFIHLQVK
jgi:hypothetical protein